MSTHAHMNAVKCPIFNYLFILGFSNVKAGYDSYMPPFERGIRFQGWHAAILLVIPGIDLIPIGQFGNNTFLHSRTDYKYLALLAQYPYQK